jgi:hypothetical protein
MRNSNPLTPGTRTSPPQFSLSLLMGVVGFCAVDFAVLGALAKWGEADAIVNVVVGALATAYLFAAFILMTRLPK